MGHAKNWNFQRTPLLWVLATSTQIPPQHKLSPDFNAICNNGDYTTTTMPKESELVERRIQEALQCRQENPNRSITSLAKEYHVPYYCLRAGLFGTPSKFNRKPAYLRLSKAQEHALYMYINCLGHLNLSVRRLFIENAVNFIL